jgi:hypothetical protein
MPKVIYLKGTDVRVAELDERQFEKLRGALQAESSADTDYFVNESALRLLESRGCDRALVARLRGLLSSGARPVAPAPTRGAFRDHYRADEQELLEVPAGAPDDEDGIDIEWRDE